MVLMRWFDPEKVFQNIEKYRVYSMRAVPAMIALMLNSPLADRYDLSSLKRCSSGSAPLPVEVLHGFQKRFNCMIYEGYGLSEAAPIVSTHWEGRPQKPGSVGQPIPEVEVRIVDGAGNDLPVGEMGELLVRGPNVSPGYYKMPEETRESFREGWLHTGDMAWQDKEGYLYIVERKKDLIIRGGFNVYPRDVEEVIYQNPKVMDAAVVGVPDRVMGEEVVAFVVLKEGEAAGEEEIIDYLQKRLANYKTPKRVFFMKELPRNSIAKVMRKTLRRLAVNAIAYQLS